MLLEIGTDNRQIGTGRNEAPVPYEQDMEEKSEPTKDNSITPADVLSGRGKVSFNHSGNKRFRDAVTLNLDRYNEATTRFDKSLVVHDILETIEGVGGRFMKYDAQSQTWQEMSRQQAKEKVGHAIRDAVNSLNARRNKKKVGSSSGVTAEVMESIQKLKTVDYAKRPRPDADYSARKRRKISEPPTVSLTCNVPIQSSPIQQPGSVVARLPTSINQSPIEQPGGTGSALSEQEAKYVQQIQQAAMMQGTVGQEQAATAFTFEEPSIHLTHHQHQMDPSHQQHHIDQSLQVQLHGAVDPVALAQQMQEQLQHEMYFTQHPQDSAHAQGIDEDDPFARAISMVLGPAPHNSSGSSESYESASGFGHRMHSAPYDPSYPHGQRKPPPQP